MIRYCDCCGKDTSVTITLKQVPDYKKAVSKKYNIVTCKKCNHSFIDPMPSGKEEIINFYQKDYYAHVDFKSSTTLKNKLKYCLIRLYYNKYSKNIILRLLQDLFYLFLKNTVNEPPIIPNGNLLDVGCGNGEYLSRVKQFGWNTYGIEPSKDAINIACSNGLQVKQGSAEDIKYDTEFFDIVRIWNVLEHTITPRKALLEAARVLKKGGYLIVYVPNFFSIDRNVFGKFWASLEIPRHLHHFSYKSLELYLEHSGLSIERSLYPGTIFSMLALTIKIMRENKINMFFITVKVSLLASKKIFNRLRRVYSGDVGICILARKD